MTFPESVSPAVVRKHEHVGGVTASLLSDAVLGENQKKINKEWIKRPAKEVQRRGTIPSGCSTLDIRSRLVVTGPRRPCR
jgi:hypothetical protein